MTESKRTEYVVLRHFNPELENQTSALVEAGRVQATNAKAAISQVVKDKAGTYVAVPARSFQPLVVEIEQRATLKFGEPKASA